MVIYWLSFDIVYKMHKSWPIYFRSLVACDAHCTRSSMQAKSYVIITFHWINVSGYFRSFHRPSCAWLCSKTICRDRDQTMCSDIPCKSSTKFHVFFYFVARFSFWCETTLNRIRLNLFAQWLSLWRFYQARRDFPCAHTIHTSWVKH